MPPLAVVTHPDCPGPCIETACRRVQACREGRHDLGRRPGHPGIVPQRIDGGLVLDGDPLGATCGPHRTAVYINRGLQPARQHHRRVIGVPDIDEVPNLIRQIGDGSEVGAYALHDRVTRGAQDRHLGQVGIGQIPGPRRPGENEWPWGVDVGEVLHQGGGCCCGFGQQDPPSAR
jgi:hypothetical protein